MAQHTLIANSGIQLFAKEVEIDLNSNSKHLFHEWFDEENVETALEVVYQLPESKKVVTLAELEKCKAISPEGKLLATEQQILAIPDLEVVYQGDLQDAEGIFSLKLTDRHCSVDKFYNQWLPLPVMELGSSGEFKQGPYNWCRCKIIPKRAHQDTAANKLKADVVIAFDTRALYQQADDYAECPVFESNSEKSKDFKLCDKISLLLDFCSGRNVWVKNCLVELVHGVKNVDEIKMNNESDVTYRYAFLASYFLLVESLAKNLDLPTFRLLRDRDVENIDVDMVIDIGNSRTAALLFENGDFTKVQPLRLQNFTQIIKDGKVNRNDESFDMRLAFKRVSFGDNMLQDSEQFVWPSLVRLGKEAEYLTHLTTDLAEGDEILSTYSSPKRYLWDFKATREEWRCVRERPQDKAELPSITGVSNYFEDDGSVNQDGVGYGRHYSRRSLMTLAFMEIVSQARAQINEYQYREFNGRISSPRRIRKIILTCPTAMSHDEQVSLHGCLNDALFVLNQFNSQRDESSPVHLVEVVPDITRQDPDHPKWIFDEATCSQFVYLYGKMRETYLNNSFDLFKLYGKKRKNEQGLEAESLVVGSLDIGAGTSDIMVCRYDYNETIPSRLKPIPLFWDSFDYAGDDMMRVLISNLLLQGENGSIETNLKHKGLETNEIRSKLYSFFGQDHNNLSFKDRLLRRDFNLQVLVPVISYFMELLSKDVDYREVSYDDVFADLKPNADVTVHFNETFGIELEQIKWVYDKNIMALNIENSLSNLLENVATIMYANDCDIVLLSGRPTSLKPISEILQRFFPVAPNRLIAINKYRIGKWYPFANEYGVVSDSKSVVAVGAMIGYLASTSGGFNDFSLDLSELGSRLRPTTDYFVVKDANVSSSTAFITPNKHSGVVHVNSFPVYIGSRQFDMNLYPVRPFYVFDINQDKIAEQVRDNNPDLPEGAIIDRVRKNIGEILIKAPFSVTIERDDYQENKEQLRVTEVEGNQGETIATSNFSLVIQSLNDPDCYWLDSGAFNINISAR